MVFPIVGGDGKPIGAYEIENSLRFNDGDNPQLSLTSATNEKKKIYCFSMGKTSRLNGETTTK